ncbi:MAG: acyl-CoA dehydratase activase-related protein [Dehalococcoidia bacterium]|nr:acyl-CoA dehydratase activase-related protein [Dehalococcoidia bacterium]
MTSIGIPRALLYYQYFPMWKVFFESLGAEVVVSDTTTKDILSEGSARVVAETCLPTKVFCGHIIALIGKCDYVFVPSIRSIEENVYNCSKFLGLPDLVKAVIPNCPPIIDADIDINKGKAALFAAIYQVGKRISRNPLRIKKASEAAWQMHQDYQSLMRREGLTPPEAIEKLTGVASDTTVGRVDRPRLIVDRGLTVALLGHPYNIFDEYINHRVLHRLRVLGVKVVSTEMAEADDLSKGVERLVGGPYWTYENDVVGSGGHYLHSEVDGLITVVAFGCGPDSVMLDVVQRYAKGLSDKPLMMLTIDEHAGEAGLVTRVEAFVDMLVRRRRRAERALTAEASRTALETEV